MGVQVGTLRPCHVHETLLCPSSCLREDMLQLKHVNCLRCAFYSASCVHVLIERPDNDKYGFGAMLRVVVEEATVKQGGVRSVEGETIASK
jgi:hypothetical protein